MGSDLITAALSGSRGRDQQAIAQAGVVVLDTLLKKNHDYGSSVFKSPRALPHLDPASGILVRLSDKLERLEQLATTPAEVDESFDDTIKDLAGYSILYLTLKGFLPSDQGEPTEAPAPPILTDEVSAWVKCDSCGLKMFDPHQTREGEICHSCRAGKFCRMMKESPLS